MTNKPLRCICYECKSIKYVGENCPECGAEAFG